MLDKYFKRPLFWDYFLSIIILAIIIIFYKRGIIVIPKADHVLSIASDLSTIALTLAGFILTLLTVLITFKSTTKIDETNPQEKNTLFELFFGSPFYFETVKHLKNCIKSLVFIAVFGFTIKLFVREDSCKFIFFYNVMGLIIIVLTLLRSLLILEKIIEIQKSN